MRVLILFLFIIINIQASFKLPDIKPIAFEDATIESRCYDSLMSLLDRFKEEKKKSDEEMTLDEHKETDKYIENFINDCKDAPKDSKVVPNVAESVAMQIEHRKIIQEKIRSLEYQQKTGINSYVMDQQVELCLESEKRSGEIWDNLNDKYIRTYDELGQYKLFEKAINITIKTCASIQDYYPKAEEQQLLDIKYLSYVQNNISELERRGEGIVLEEPSNKDKIHNDSLTFFSKVGLFLLSLLNLLVYIFLLLLDLLVYVLLPLVLVFFVLKKIIWRKKDRTSNNDDAYAKAKKEFLYEEATNSTAPLLAL